MPWTLVSFLAGNLVKLGGGFYCGLVNMNGKSKYVLNAFFMDMRNKFTAPGGSIHYWTVEWDEAKLPWEDFRGRFLAQQIRRMPRRIRFVARSFKIGRALA